jgi:hypothetical protein
MHKHTFIPLVASVITLTACQLDPKNIGTPDSASEPSTGAATSTDASPTETSPGTGGATDTSTGGATDTGGPWDPICFDWMPFWSDRYLWSSAWEEMADEPCVLESTELIGNELRGVLDCPKYEKEQGIDIFEFFISSGPFPVLPPIGSTINVSGAAKEIDFGKDSETLILRSEGKLLYAAGRALYSDPSFAGPEAYAPLTIARVEFCPLGGSGDGFDYPDGDGFVCQGYARSQLRVSAVGSEDLLLLDDEVGMIAAGQTTYAVDVRQAWRVENCEPEGPLNVTGVFAFAIAAQ